MATELAKAYVQIVPTSHGIKGSIANVLSPEAESAGKVSGAAVGANLVSMAKNIIIAGGIGATIKKSLDAGGALQQSFGGLDTIYGEASAGMKELAAEASKAGISANSYAEQAVSMGAALKQSFGGDVTAAAKSANIAILDMADNSAKMGTDLTSIQNAYQGFAKQNYTMLDNLKLGYGGTKEEMKRLLADASELSGVEYDISSLGDVYEAIHVIQEDLGLTGVAAYEAEETFTGSFGSMKAAAENLWASMSTGEDLGPSMTILVKSAKNALVGNMLPMLGNFVKAVPAVLKEGFAALDGGSLVAPVLDAVNSLTASVKENLPGLIPIAMDALVQFSGFLRENVGQLFDAGLALIMGIADSLIANIPVFIETVPTIVTNIAGLINDNAPKLLVSGITLLVHLGQGILSAIPTLIENIPQIIQAIVAVWSAFNWMNLGRQVVNFIKNGVRSLAAQVPNALRNIGNNAVNFFKGINWAGLGRNVITLIGNGLRALLTSIPNILKSIGSLAMSAFRSINWLSVGSAVIKGIAAGISGGAKAIVNAAKNAAKSALNAAKDFLGIHSPSRVFRDQIGKNMALGIAEGYEDYMPYSRFQKTTARVTRSTAAAVDTDKQAGPSEYSDLLAAVRALGDRISRLQMVTDTGALVGALAEPMNEELGTIARMEALA